MKDAPVVMLGSHYDSVVNGGAFDGVAGSVSALEVMRVLTEEGFVNDYPLELILMNAEEGLRSDRVPAYPTPEQCSEP